MIVITQSENVITFNLEIYLINQSSDKTINLYTLADTIKKQIESVYSGRFGALELNTRVNVTPLYKYTLKSIYTKLIIAISSTITNDNAAEADFGGLLIKLNPKHIPSINSGTNKRTIPHEFGHILGLDHPHANAKFDSINLNASALEQAISIEEKKTNLMCQSWYVQKANTSLNNALTLTEDQIKLILENYLSQKLSKNYSIKKTFFSHKWIGKV